jgi:hypothetical protein
LHLLAVFTLVMLWQAVGRRAAMTLPAIAPP